MNKVVFIVAQRGYQEQEYNVPKRVLEEVGIEVVTASKSGGTCVGMHGGMIKESISIADVKVENYSAVIFIGGSGAQAYQDDEVVLHLSQEAFHQYKLLGAICIAPLILAKAGVLRGRKATVWDGDRQQSKVLIANGAKYTSESVTVDGKIVTANGPGAAEEFAKALLKILLV